MTRVGRSVGAAARGEQRNSLLKRGDKHKNSNSNSKSNIYVPNNTP